MSQKDNPEIERCKLFKKRILKNKKQYNPLEIEFPILTVEYVEYLTKGVYQLKQSKCYSADHMDENGNYLFELYEEEIENEITIHVQLRSRFSSQSIHNLWVEYNPTLSLTEGQAPILNYYCECRAGARIFGMCAHVTSILWFLGIARNDKDLMKKRNCDLFKLLCYDSK